VPVPIPYADDFGVALTPSVCRWKKADGSECDHLATGPDGVCDRHAVEYWRSWRERQPDIWVEVTCWKCHKRFSITIKPGDAKHLWPFKLCAVCAR
jgi:hypothetical protein